MSNFRVVAIKTEANLYEKTHEIEETSSRCGEIYVGDNAKKWTFICTLCDKSFREIDEFMSHIRGSHVNIPPPPSVEPRASGHLSMQQNSFKYESPSFNSLDNELINEFQFVDYNDFLDANVQDVPDDILSETSRQVEVPAKQDVTPDTRLRYRRSSNLQAESCSPCPSVKHTKEVEGNRKRRFCQICKRKFQYPSLYRNHMVKHTTDRPFECAICKKDFKSKQSVRYHLKTHQREKPFKCEICPLGFWLEARFVSHMETHKSENSHPCDVCGKLNRSNAEKMSHMRSHAGDRPFGCKYCTKRFRLRRHLGNHLKLHFTYRCERCRKQFRNGVPMIKPYTCPDCDGKTDIKKIHLDYDEDEDSEVSDDEEKDVTFHPVKYSEREILEPNSVKRYICKHCKKRYASKRGLTAHISLKH